MHHERYFHTLKGMMLTLRKLRRLVVLAEEGNFTRAAERLGMTQPSLSRSIAELEETCGLRLFDRGRLGVTPTAAGAGLVADARQILGHVGAVEHDLTMQSRGEAGRVAFGVGPLAASYLLARLLSESLARWPSLMISASIGTTQSLIGQVLAGQLDFCICAANQLDDNPALAVRRLGRFRLGYFVRAGHPLARHEGSLTWADLAPYPRGAGRTPTITGGSPSGTFGALGTTVECDDYDVFRQVILQTDTIWLTSDRLLSRELAEDKIAELHPAPVSVRDADMALVRLAGRRHSPAMHRVIDVATAMLTPV